MTCALQEVANLGFNSRIVSVAFGDRHIAVGDSNRKVCVCASRCLCLGLDLLGEWRDQDLLDAREVGLRGASYHFGRKEEDARGNALSSTSKSGVVACCGVVA